MTKNVRIAIIGLGAIGRSYLRAMATIPGCKPVAACDVCEEARKRFSEEFPGIPVFSADVDILEI
jgi:predicted dehydrogenase